jgi:hypothetical protein
MQFCPREKTLLGRVASWLGRNVGPRQIARPASAFAGLLVAIGFFSLKNPAPANAITRRGQTLKDWGQASRAFRPP